VLAQTSSSSATGLPTRVLGKTGQRVSIICLGGRHIGRVEDSEATRIMHAAIDEGINFFDNAWDYNDGESEIKMGKALAMDGAKSFSRRRTASAITKDR
jgi:aryl-alcohol dehydrogenase-like predicted oxidoreductase